MRSGPGTNNGVITVLPTNASGVVLQGPVSATGYQWYQLNMGAAGIGWVAGDYLALVSTSTATPTRTSVATTPAPTRTATRTATTVPGGFPIGSTVRTTTSVNMRSGPGTNNGVITVLATNAMGTVLQGPISATGYQWYQLNTGASGIGWVAGDFLAQVSPASVTPSRTPTRTPTTVPSGFPAGSTVRTTDALNMRSGPGTEFTVLHLLATGTACTVLAGPTAADGYQWYEVNCGANRIGWVAGEFLESVTAASIEEPSTAAETEATSPPDEQDATLTPTLEVAQSDTEVAEPPATETATAEPTQTEPPASPDVVIENTATTVVEIPTEALPVETEPQPLPIARVQRSEGSSPAQALVDRDPSTVWTTDGAAIVPLAAFIADLDAVQYVSVIRWQSGAGGLSGTLHVSVSTDNETWTELPIDSLAAPGEWQELAVGTEVRYVRFVFVNDAGLPVVGGVAELEVWP
jgi:uncharacterized protein YraI